MKLLKLGISAALALTTPVAAMLALTWWQPTIARADRVPNGPNAPAAPHNDTSSRLTN